MIFRAWSDGRFRIGEREVRCALGPTGVIAAGEKREGDGATPLGAWPMRRVLYRPDRGARPVTPLQVGIIAEDDGWCDDPADEAYNRPVQLPYPASAEVLCREDGLYDLVVVLGYNDEPPVAGRGSAIFLHVSAGRPTAGCVSLPESQLLHVLRWLRPAAHPVVHLGIS